MTLCVSCYLFVQTFLEDFRGETSEKGLVIDMGDNLMGERCHRL